jgi:hypothetical protein
MSEIQEILIALDEKGLNDEQIMEIAGIKDKDSLNRWYGGGKCRNKTLMKLRAHLQRLQPVSETCPYGVPTEEMFTHAIRLRLNAIEALSTGVSGWNGTLNFPESVDTKEYRQLKHQYELLLKHKNYYEIGHTKVSRKSGMRSHKTLTTEMKIRIVAEYHDDKTIREHFQNL